MARSRQLFVAGGVLFLLLAAGFFFQLPPVTQVFWPWPDGRLTYVFVASIVAAIAAPLLWIGLSGELAAAGAGGLNLAALNAPAAAYLLSLGASRGEPRLRLFGLACVLSAAVSVAIYRWSRGLAFRDPRPSPAPVRASFALFTALLVAVGTALVLRSPHIFPWPLHPDTSVLVGVIFLGAAVYFAAGLRRPLWANAKGPLIGFLAYDLVLIGPFLAHFGTVRPEHRLSLILYVAVLLSSGALAVAYLWRLRQLPQPTPRPDTAPPLTPPAPAQVRLAPQRPG